MKTLEKEAPERDFELKFLPDVPTAEDEIGVHRVIADNLKQIIMGEKTKPFVIGLYGSWGSGKSSIVEMLRASADRRFKIIVIDAWRKDKANFLRQFIKKLADGLLSKKEAEEVKGTVNFRTAKQTSRLIPGPWATFIFVAFLIAASAVIIGGIWTWWKIHKNPELQDFPLKETEGIFFLVLTAVVFQWLLPRYSRKIDTRTEEITIEDPAWFREIYFKDILNKSNGQTVCVAIDNLDRVEPDDAVAIIKFIKTFIVDVEDKEAASNKTNITFLIPCDDRQLIKLICGETSVVVQSEFLRKFVTVSMRIPPTLEQDNANYIRSLIKRTGLQGDRTTLENMAFIISRACDRNPRKPKTILNHFVARFNLAKRFPACWQIAKKDRTGFSFIQF